MKSFILAVTFVVFSGCAGGGIRTEFLTLEQKADNLCKSVQTIASEYTSLQECQEGVRKNLWRAELYKHNSTHDVCLNGEIAPHYKDYDECFVQINKIKDRNRLAAEKRSNKSDRQQAAALEREYASNQQFTDGMKQIAKGIAHQSDQPISQPIQANCTTTQFGEVTQTQCN